MGQYVDVPMAILALKMEHYVYVPLFLLQVSILGGNQGCQVHK